MHVRPLLPVAVLLASLATTGCESPEQFLGVSLATALLVGLAALVLIVVAVIDLLRSPMPLTEKVIWGLVIWFVPFVGAIVYLIVGKR